MFEVVRLEDTVHISPSEFGKPILVAATEELNAKYPNKARAPRSAAASFCGVPTRARTRR
jgi:DNA-directed RNA polymerase subunit E'/Rpb7